MLAFEETGHELEVCTCSMYGGTVTPKRRRAVQGAASAYCSKENQWKGRRRL